MIRAVKTKFHNMNLTQRIRFFYYVLLIPILVMVLLTVDYIVASNRQYEEMIDSALVAGEFSSDFKKDFDDETYLLIVGNKTVENSRMGELLDEANGVINELSSLTPTSENRKRLTSAKKYLKNLDTYKSRIEENLSVGDKYEENMEIWENDVQIVTSLLQETVYDYIYSELQELDAAHTAYQANYYRILTALIVAFAVITAAMLLLSYYIPKSITQPIVRLSEVTDQVARGNLTARSDVEEGGEVGVLSDSLNAMIDKINELLDQVKEEQIHLRHAELELLQAQINPHFLYNTLDTIVWLAEGGDQKQVVSMVKSLSEFFRTSLNQGRDIITIEEELLHARSYLEIQQVRYQDILTYEIDVPEELYPYLITKITIQPLVENALYHGIKNTRTGGSISVTGEKLSDRFVIRVKDNGIGMTPERLAKVNDRIAHKDPKGDEVFGLYNVNERIQLKFGGEYGIKVYSVYEEGTTVEIWLPLETAE